MSDTDGKKPANPRDQKSARAQPVKRSRKRKASRPPTIDVDAVHLEEKPEPEAKAAPKATGSGSEDIDDTKANLRQGFGYRAIALSAGVGAVASVGLFAGVFGMNFFSSDNQMTEDRITQLSSQIEKVSVAVGDAQNTENIDAAVKALKQQVEVISNRAPAAYIKSFGDRITTLEAGISVLQRPADTSVEFKQLAERLDALDSTVLEAKSIADKSLRQASTLEQAVKTAGENVAGATGTSASTLNVQGLRLAGFESQIKRLEENLSQTQAKAAKPEDVAELQKTVGALQQQARTLTSQIATLDAQIAKADAENLTQRLSALENVDTSNYMARRAALTFVLEGLVQAVEAGGSFKRDLDIVIGAVPQNAQLESLQAHADDGVKYAAALKREFPAVLREILDVKEAQSDSGVVDKLMGKAKSLIRVRRVGDVSGNSRDAIVARMEVYVEAGDLAAAVAQAKGLEGPAATAAKSWIDAVNQRLQMIEFVSKTRDDIIAGLGSSTSLPATKE